MGHEIAGCAKIAKWYRRTSVFNLVQECNLTDHIKFMSFDTTATNNGEYAGACVLLEKKMGKDLTSLACRHQIMELIVAKVFDMLMGPFRGPNSKLFHRFGECWSSIDRLSYESGLKVQSTALVLDPIRDKLIKFIQQQLVQFQLRDDYRELLQLF